VLAVGDLLAANTWCSCIEEDWAVKLLRDWGILGAHGSVSYSGAVRCTARRGRRTGSGTTAGDCCLVYGGWCNVGSRGCCCLGLLYIGEVNSDTANAGGLVQSEQRLLKEQC
jgi:hypothetical protein